MKEFSCMAPRDWKIEAHFRGRMFDCKAQKCSLMSTAQIGREVPVVYEYEE